MGELVEEVKLWNTPVIGAFLLWKFTKGYCDNHPNGDAPIGLLHFVASAILTNQKLIEPVSNMRDNLQSYVRSFEDKKNSDILLSIQERTKSKFEYTLKSIDIAIAEGMLVWDVESGKIYPREVSSNSGNNITLKHTHKRNGEKAELLGKWFSQHELSTIAAYLKIVF